MKRHLRPTSTVARRQKPPRCPRGDAGHSADATRWELPSLGRKETPTAATRRVGLGDSVPREISHREGQTLCASLIRGPRGGGKRREGARAGVGGRACLVGTASQCGKMESSGDDGGDGRTQRVCLQPPRAPLKWLRRSTSREAGPRARCGPWAAAARGLPCVNPPGGSSETVAGAAAGGPGKGRRGSTPRGASGS